MAFILIWAFMGNEPHGGTAKFKTAAACQQAADYLNSKKNVRYAACFAEGK